MIDFPFQVPQIVSFCGAAGATSLDYAVFFGLRAAAGAAFFGCLSCLARHSVNCLVRRTFCLRRLPGFCGVVIGSGTLASRFHFGEP